MGGRRLTSTQERTRWRDQELSERHRRYGPDVPAQDVDLLLVEYDACKPRALIEYKHQSAREQYISNPQFQVLINLANAADLPAFCVRYAANFEWWKVVPLNDKAKKIIPNRIVLNEQRYVRFLYHLRGRTAPQSVLDNLDAPAV